MTDNVGISFKDALQEALVEVDSVESDLPSTTVEIADVSEVPIADQPVVESNEDAGLFDGIFVEKEVNDPPPGEESLSFMVNGRLMSIPEIEAEVMMKADYTRKTQELAELRREADKALVLWRALEDKPQETVRALWQRVAAGQSPSQEATVTPQAPTDIEALVVQKLQEVLHNDPRLQRIEAEAAWNEVNVILSQVEKDNNVTLSNGDKQAILLKAQELGTDNIPAAFDVLMAQKMRLDRERSNAQANSSSSGRNSSESDDSPPTKVFGSWREAMNDSLREENALDTVFNFA